MSKNSLPVSIRLSASERDLVAEAAKYLNVTPSAFARLAVVAFVNQLAPSMDLAKEKDEA